MSSLDKVQSNQSLDERWMRLALEEARKGLYTASPNPRVGCVLVKEDRCISTGFHRQTGGPHAEVEAISAASESLTGATAYVSLEPCCHVGRTGPCSEALIEVGIARVVIAMRDPDPRVAGKGIERLRAAGIHVDVGLMEKEAKALNRGFISRLSRHRPWVRSKIAATLDGGTALMNGVSQWITGPTARADNQHYRAQADVLLTGIGTILNDDPLLNVRDLFLERQPLRVIADSHFRFPEDAKMIDGQPILIITCQQDEAKSHRLSARQVETVIVKANQQGQVDLPSLMGILHERHINEVHVEAGSRLNGALLEAGLIDELLVYYAAKVMGSPSRGMFDVSAKETLMDLPVFELDSMVSIGDDMRVSWIHQTETN